MIEFKFPCPNCGQRLQANDGHSGVQINCPACQQPLVVPHLPGTRPSEPALAMPPLLPAASEPAGPRGNNRFLPATGPVPNGLSLGSRPGCWFLGRLLSPWLPVCFRVRGALRRADRTRRQCRKQIPTTPQPPIRKASARRRSCKRSLGNMNPSPAIAPTAPPCQPWICPRLIRRTCPASTGCRRARKEPRPSSKRSANR